MEQLFHKLYGIECYIDVDSPTVVLEDKPSGNWMRFVLRELTWWEYDTIVSRAFTRTKNTYEWTINAFKKKRLLLKEAIESIVEKDGDKITIHKDNCYDLLPDVYGELLSDYYDKKVTMSIEEIIDLEGQIRSYMDPGEVNKTKPPYDRMIIELDIARRLGGYTRSDIMSFSKKDMDKIFILGRLGLKIPFQQGLNDISTGHGLNEIQDQELIDMAREMVDFSPPTQFKKQMTSQET